MLALARHVRTASFALVVVRAKRSNAGWTNGGHAQRSPLLLAMPMLAHCSCAMHSGAQAPSADHSTQPQDKDANTADSDVDHSADADVAPLSPSAAAALAAAEQRADQPADGWDATAEEETVEASIEDEEPSAPRGSAAPLEAVEEDNGPVWSGSAPSRRRAHREQQSDWAGGGVGYRGVSSASLPPNSREARQARQAERQFTRRMVEESRRHLSESPAVTLPAQPLPIEVVMAPGDSEPRMSSKRPLAPITMPRSAEEADAKSTTATALLAAIDNSPYPTLSPIARLAPGLEDSIHVRGVLRVGDAMTHEERTRADEAPMLPHSATGATEECRFGRNCPLPQCANSHPQGRIIDSRSSSGESTHSSASSAAASDSASAAASSDAAIAAPAPCASASASASPLSSSNSLVEWSRGFATEFEHVVHPHLVDLSPLPGHGFITSSRDSLLLRLAREQRCTLMGSTSSTGRILAHIIYSLGNFHHIRTEGVLIPEFDVLPKRPTSAERSPATMLFRKRREGEERIKDVESPKQEAEVRARFSVASSSPSSGDSATPASSLIFDALPSVWAIDSAPSWSNPANRILQELGHTLEAAFTHSPEEFTSKFVAPLGMTTSLSARRKHKKTPVAHHSATRPGHQLKRATHADQKHEAHAAVDAAGASVAAQEEKDFDSGASAAADAAADADALSHMLQQHARAALTQPTSFDAALAAGAKPDVRDAYLFCKMGGIMFRSQLDCWAPELKDRKELQSFMGGSPASSGHGAAALPSWPGWELGGLVFDLKTRATLPIRLFCRRYSDLLDYHLLYRRGLLYSFEREYYDMQRAAFLKYSLQCRIGRMGGVMIGYHNTARTYAFHYVSVKEMDEALFGHALVGEWMFQQATAIMSRHIAGAGAQRDEDAILTVIEAEHRRNWAERNYALRRRETLEIADAARTRARQNPRAAGTALLDEPADANSAPIPAEELDPSPAPVLTSLKVIVASQQTAPDLVNIYVELLPLETAADPQANLPFLERYTSQRHVDSLPNYRVREHLRSLRLDARGPRTEIVSRLEGALALKPMEQLPEPEVFLALARMNLIHKFVIRIRVAEKGPGDASRAAGYSGAADSFDPEGRPLINPDDMSTVIDRWVRDYVRRDHAAAAQTQGAASVDADEDDDESSERSAGCRGPPISQSSISAAPSTRASVSTSVTHLSVRNGRISAQDLAADYRRALHFSLKISEGNEEEADGDMVDALRISMQGLVASQQRSAKVAATVARERQKRMRMKQQELGRVREEGGSVGDDAEQIDGERMDDSEVDGAATNSSSAASSPSSPSTSSSQRSAAATVSREQVQAWRLLRAAVQQAVAKPPAVAKRSAKPAAAAKPAAKPTAPPAQPAPTNRRRAQ